MFRQNLKLGLFWYVYLTILVNLRESDALCLGLDQTACGSASGCAWKSKVMYSRSTEKAFSANTACVESCQDTSTVNRAIL